MTLKKKVREFGKGLLILKGSSQNVKKVYGFEQHLCTSIFFTDMEKAHGFEKSSWILKIIIKSFKKDHRCFKLIL